ncbi:hypothetical protein [Pseudarthrobacter oxydans]|uniref:hypothetical protein n=1 Tax=Pseudarthrobacter oxydans TaxID=1671 RepID=UPI00341B333C
MSDNPDESEHYRLALEAEPALAAVEAVVDLICDKGLPSQKAWSSIVKPLALPFIGNMRGIGADSATNPRRPDLNPTERMEHLIGSMTDLGEHVAKLEKYRLPATTATEEWMRTSEAWDAVTTVWIQKMKKADLSRK